MEENKSLEAKLSASSQANALEQHARDLLRRRSSINNDGSSPVSILERQITLTLDHIDGLRIVHEKQNRNLSRIESYINTEIFQRSPKPPFYYDTRVAERDMLRARLLRLEDERRGLDVRHLEKLQNLRDRLSDLVNKHTILYSENGNRQTRSKT